MSAEAITRDLRALEPALRAQGVTRLAIFGSRARGDARADSDLDVLIDVEPGRKFSLLDLVGVQHTIGDRLGVEANVTMRRSLEADTAREIARDIVEIFG